MATAAAVCLAEKEGDFHSSAGKAVRLAGADPALQYPLTLCKKDPYYLLSLAVAGRSVGRSVGRSHAPSSLISLLFCSAAAKSAFSSLHYYCPLLHTVYPPHTVRTTEREGGREGGRHRRLRRRLQRLFGATRSIRRLASSAHPSVRPSISFPLLHRLIRPIFLPLTMGSLSAAPPVARSESVCMSAS